MAPNAPDSFRLSLGWFGDTPVLQLAGNLVYGQTIIPVHDLATGLASAGHARVVIDVTGIESIDSSGISVLLDIRQVFGASKIPLLRPPERLRNALAVLRVAPLFEWIDSEEELVRTLGPWREPDECHRSTLSSAVHPGIDSIALRHGSANAAARKERQPR